MKLSLVIPCYNEAKNIPILLERCKDFGVSQDVEVIIVDNGSTDNSQAILKKLLPNYPMCRSIRVKKNHGYGLGILSGLKAARGEILSWTHADMQTDPLDVIYGLSLFKKHGPDIFVKGRRYGRPITDNFFTVGMSIFESLLLLKLMWDINAQPTMFSRDFFESWVSPPEDFSLDLYAYYQAKIKGVRIFRFPVLFSNRMHGVSHWNIDWTSKKKFIVRTVRYSIALRKSNG